MNILAFDTALGACSAAVSCDGEIVARRHEERARGHAEALLPMIEAVRGESGFAYRDLDLLAVSVGPGTFTGLRIGIAAARGLALATDLPVVGFTTLHAIAAGLDAAAGDEFMVALDARRGQVYCQLFSFEVVNTTAISPISSTWLAVLTPFQPAGLFPYLLFGLAGSGAAAVFAALACPGAVWLGPQSLQPDAAVLARLAEEHGLPPSGAEAPAPLYLRPPDAKLPTRA